MFMFLSSNHFSGSIPATFGESITLKSIWLDDNKLNGTIPEITPNGWPTISEFFALRTHFITLPENDINVVFCAYRGGTSTAQSSSWMDTIKYL